MFTLSGIPRRQSRRSDNCRSSFEYLKQGGPFDGWVADLPLSFTSPNAPRKRDVLGTMLLSVLAGHRRYAHVTALRCDAVNPPLLA